MDKMDKTHTLRLSEDCFGNQSVKFEKEEHTKIHPLLLEHILDNVFSHLILEKNKYSGKSFTTDIRNIRLVCWMWWERATRLYQDRSHLLFSYGSADRDRLNRYLSIMSTSAMIPVQNYTISGDVFSPVNNQLIEKFLQILIPEAVNMRLQLSKSDFLFTIPSYPFTYKPLKLRRLEINCTNQPVIPFPSPFNETPSFLGRLLNAAHNLQEFSLDIYGESLFSRKRAESALTGVCRSLPNSLKNLKISAMYLSDIWLGALAKKDLQLESCFFNFYRAVNRCSSKAVKSFFEGQSKTLKDLTLLCPSSILNTEFPKMEGLVKLKLSVEGGLPQITISHNFPNLVSLDLKSELYPTNEEGEAACMELLSGDGVSSMQELHLPRYCKLELVRRVACSFSNLKALHLSETDLTGETLQEVFIRMTELEQLSLDFRYDAYGRRSGDYLLSGVSRQDCFRISKQKNFDNICIEDLQLKPSILSLTKLKTLELWLSPWYQISFSNFTAHFILLKMSNLEEISTNCFYMNKDYLSRLRDKLKTLSIYDTSLNGYGCGRAESDESESCDYGYADQDDDFTLDEEVASIHL